LCLSVFALAMVQNVSAQELKVGDAAPDFELKGSDGKMYSLKEFKGKKAVIIAWFPRAFTGGCTAECKSLKENGDAIRKFDVAYFTASTDKFEGDKGNEAFAKSLGLDYPILSDPEGKAAKAFGVLNASGTAAGRVTIYIDKDGKIAFIDKVKDAGKQGTAIAEKLKELKTPEKT
jgi:thioredoxin-dependent peroxiredoxin